MSADESVTKQWDKKEQENKANARREELQKQREEEEEEPSFVEKWFMRIVTVLSVVSGITGLFMVIAQVLGLLYDENGPVQYTLRVYVILLSFVVILVELGWTEFATESFIFKHWVPRGLYYGFIGVLGFEENDTTNWNGNFNEGGYDVTTNFTAVVSWIIVFCGIGYFVLGFFCGEYIYKNAQKEYDGPAGKPSSSRPISGKPSSSKLGSSGDLTEFPSDGEFEVPSSAGGAGVPSPKGETV